MSQNPEGSRLERPSSNVSLSPSAAVRAEHADAGSGAAEVLFERRFQWRDGRSAGGDGGRLKRRAYQPVRYREYSKLTCPTQREDPTICKAITIAPCNTFQKKNQQATETLPADDASRLQNGARNCGVGGASAAWLILRICSYLPRQPIISMNQQPSPS
jgi:hypothetical protein